MTLFLLLTQLQVGKFGNHTTDVSVDYATASDGYIYFVYNHPSLGQVPGSGILALNESTGEKVWNYSAPDILIFNQRTPVVNDGKVFVSYTDLNASDASFSAGGVYVLNAIDGTFLWNFKTSSSTSPP